MSSYVWLPSRSPGGGRETDYHSHYHRSTGTRRRVPLRPNDRIDCYGHDHAGSTTGEVVGQENNDIVRLHHQTDWQTTNVAIKTIRILFTSLIFLSLVFWNFLVFVSQKTRIFFRNVGFKPTNPNLTRNSSPETQESLYFSQKARNSLPKTQGTKRQGKPKKTREKKQGTIEKLEIDAMQGLALIKSVWLSWLFGLCLMNPWSKAESMYNQPCKNTMKVSLKVSLRILGCRVAMLSPLEVVC